MARNPKTSYTTNGLKRWSCRTPEGSLPTFDTIKSIHVYDFDNTLFCSPLPNPQIWTPPTIGQLQNQDVFADGGWWHSPAILEATGDGLEIEEPRGWAEHWNETVFELSKLSIQQREVVSVLLTGRSEPRFAELVNRILNSRDLAFDLVVLKPEVGPQGQSFTSTMDFKQVFLRDLIFTYKTAEEIRVYEDRPGHVKGFRDYFEKLNKSLLSHRIDEPAPTRGRFAAEVLPVCELRATLNPETEVETVQRMVNSHNHAFATGGPNPQRSRNKIMAIRENFIYCGYLINPKDSARLISLTNCPPNLIDNGELKFLASSILISPHRADHKLLAKVGGKGHKVTWQVTGLAILENRIWAARVAPLDEAEQVHTQDITPLVVLALRKGTRPIDAGRIQNWNPVQPEKALIFETVVGDKVALRLEEDSSAFENFGGRVGHARSGKNDGSLKRKFANGDDEFGKQNQGGRRNQQYAIGDNGDRHAQARYFNQGKQENNNGGRNFSGGHRGGRGFAGGGKGQHNGELRGGGRSNDRGRGGGGRSRGRPPGYKSLDDYGPNNFDGAGDAKGMGGGADMVMNY